MKKVFTLLLLLIAFLVNSQESKTTQKTKIVEASCGQCQFGINAKGCDLAVRIDGKSYFVEGTKIDEYGNAHAKDGFCKTIRKAEVAGKIVNKRFIATYFRLLAEITK
ncbi:DUF6370 family protein [Flavobacterium psychrophilum]|uniref:Glutaminyl-tRNA synthetase n=1 Tax=Flavobacterium psychrophilum (strain ATCC 49511 / DSM 21280 / CIP 103535 / JIP02/86) TaxID=402612 RepID=A6GWP7_FLAPJ|nr:DUF6370 family protein [Flavobacterium psychrophilum]AIN70904.1 glutaminyl-tRNA synthetase [Flavobacterium psychrophilum FPG101]AKC18633.1 glutaminyl-tRNA synthetase [Flavobacterium psychrophilum]AKC21000.1 glutaminyl-tRNA synthetase [Flavobacterium psychrophilum]AKC23372.1 glutaminyl-tRNA synthetase [Flavobacterium psychrophilum]AKC25738.1 glutaminyl-tRNA synthetase [Flavobacterium psychrophilum]